MKVNDGINKVDCMRKCGRDKGGSERKIWWMFVSIIMHIIHVL